jgi:hypothetical protein
MTRPKGILLMKSGSFLLLFTLLAVPQLPGQDRVEKWGIYEISLPGPKTGNPFVGIELRAAFINGDRRIEPEGFYDGNGLYKIRFMPDREGLWTYETKSNREELAGKTGRFLCVAPLPENHGPVRIRRQYHFAYEDGKPFYPFGTTIYEWIFQTEETRQQTLRTLRSSPFNKARFLLVPPWNEKYLSGPLTLDCFPFEGTSKDTWDFSRFNPVFFQRFEKCLTQILELGIEADVILFRPYDNGKWGFDRMEAATNDRFVRYAVARLAAYRNVWWSLANENSFMRALTESDWDRMFKLIQDGDPYGHLRSIHNAEVLYDYRKPLVTHVSLQYYNAVREFGAAALVRDIYRKPVIHDEINYEGDSDRRWGQLTPEEMLYRFWLAYIGGTYATHGEVYQHPSQIDWISEGGVLRGRSPERIGFLRRIVESGPAEGLEPIDRYYARNIAGKHGEYYLIYFGKEKPNEWEFRLPGEALQDGMKFQAEVIDTWHMTTIPISRIFEIKKRDRYEFQDKDGLKIALPGQPYMALRIRRLGRP